MQQTTKNMIDFLKTPAFADLEQKAFDAIQRIFPCEPELLDAIPLDEIILFFQNDILSSKTPFLIRVAGQSGAGKSSQLIPAIEAALSKKNHIKINVGAFAHFHPKYKEWQAKTPDEMREKTNGFALRALVLFYKHCILKKVNIVLDMTLLEPEIDLYLMTLAKVMGYRIQTHILCVPKKVSDLFIHQRQLQTGRHVRQTSSVYFFNALLPSLKALTHSSLFNKEDALILWAHDLMHPIRKTHLNNSSATHIVAQYQQKRLRIKNPKVLLKSKRVWIKNFMEAWDV